SATISAAGLLTAVSNGTVTVTATANDGSAVFGTLVVTISNQGANNTNIGSAIYSINYSNNTINNVPLGLSVTDFKNNIFVAPGAVFELYQPNGTVVRIGNVFNLDKLIVTAADGVTTRTYTVNVDSILPSVTPLGNNSTDYTIPQNGTVVLVFNKPISSNSRQVIENSLLSGADRTISFSWNNEKTQLIITGNPQGVTTFANDVFALTIVDTIGNVSNNVLLIDSAISSNQVSPDGQGNISLTPGSPEAIINNSNPVNTINIPSGVNNPTINFDPLINNGTGTLPQITINGGNAGNIVIDFPQGVIVTNPNTNWNGVITGPQLMSASFPNEVVGIAFQFGVPGNTLTFDKAIRINIPNQAGKRIKISNDGLNYTEITNGCSSDSQAAGNALPAGGDCKINVGNDLVIWTKHLTIFVTFTTVPSPIIPSSGSTTGSVVLLGSQITGAADYSFSFNVNNTRITARNEVALLFSNDQRFKRFSVANGKDFNNSIIEENIGFKIWKIPGRTGIKEICLRFYDDYGNPTVPVCRKIIYLDRESITSLLARKASISKQAVKKPEIVKNYKEEERPSKSRLYATYPIKKNILDINSPLLKNATLSELVESTKYGDYSVEVKNLQRLLKAYGFFPKDLEITGFYGEDTLASVNKYKKFLELNSKYQSLANY
ncbi:MAG: hypothetical protein PHW52_01175, partial [Candidatus Pacebacteria bacterium]|nr:hypothetical protein [Candidatus Paceibacterota bacterium]